MSYITLMQQSLDSDLIGRLDAAVRKEAWANETLGATDFGKAVRQGTAVPQQVFMWALCTATEESYEYALLNNNPAPGKDESVISDADILTCVQTNWPQEWPPPAEPITS